MNEMDEARYLDQLSKMRDIIRDYIETVPEEVRVKTIEDMISELVLYGCDGPVQMIQVLEGIKFTLWCNFSNVDEFEDDVCSDCGEGLDNGDLGV